MNTKIITLIVGGVLLAGGLCFAFGSDMVLGLFNKDRNGIIVGGPDEHGCLPSAGEMWSRTKNKCIRPGAEGPGGCLYANDFDKDEYGCYSSLDYTWSEEENKCVRIRTWLIYPFCEDVLDHVQRLGGKAESQESTLENQDGGDSVVQEEQPRDEIIIGGRDEHGCLPSAGEMWSRTKNKCIRPWEAGSYSGSEPIQYL